MIQTNNMDKITMPKITKVKCPRCEYEYGYFRVEEGTTYFNCPDCKNRILAKHYRSEREAK